MRNVMKAATLESKFPILSVEHDCIISKDADITVCYRVELPELFTVTQAEYEAIHSAWAKAVKVLPNYSIVHKQDFFIEESTGQDSLSPFGMRMVDPLAGKPIHLYISDLPMKRGIITNRNKFILGPSDSGKSFFTNHMVRQYYEQGTHMLLVDTGNSYQGLCNLINARTHGEDGIYFTYEESDPIAFNPFYVEDGVFDIEKKESIKTL